MRTTRSSFQEHVGYRYIQWLNIESTLTADEKAAAYDAFAAEFESLPPHQEPDCGWADDMAYMCRRIARRHRGEPVGEWEPTWQRRSKSLEGRFRQVPNSDEALASEK